MAAQVQPLLVLQARAEARAILYADGDYVDVAEAIKPLMAYAFDSGIVDQIGAERAHAIRVSPLFHRVRAIA